VPSSKLDCHGKNNPEPTFSMTAKGFVW
jgi:hypothetical protein